MKFHLALEAIAARLTDLESEIDADLAEKIEHFDANVALNRIAS